MSTNKKALSTRGEKVRTLLITRGWAQAELSRRTEIPEYRISRLLRGAEPSAKEAAILSNVLNVPYRFWTEEES